MAEGSKKGACSCNTQAAKANCLAHDRRQGKVPSYVNPSLTKDNRTVYEDAKILGRKSIVPLVKQAEKLYTERTGQKCQKSFTPFRESVLVVKEGVTDEQLMAWKAKAEALMGWRVLGIWAHNDEGHYHSRFIEGDTDFAINHHVHVLWDCQDPNTGKSLRPTRGHFSAMQDVLAESVGMERGNFAKDTGTRRRSSQEQRIKAQEERIAQLERISKLKDDVLAEKDAAIDLIKEELATLSKSKAVKEAAIAKIGEYADKARAAGAAAAESGKAVGNWVKGKLNLSDKDETIKELQQQIQTLTTSKDDAVNAKVAAEDKAKKASTKGYNQALSDVRQQTHLSWPQWESTSLQGIVSKVNEEVDAHKMWYRHAQESDRKVVALQRQLSQGSEQDQGLHR